MRRYIREIQKKRFKEPLNKLNDMNAQSKFNIEYSLTHLFAIKHDSVCKSTFTPRIPGTGLSISVTNPGFVVSIVLSTFALRIYDCFLKEQS